MPQNPSLIERLMLVPRSMPELPKAPKPAINTLAGPHNIPSPSPTRIDDPSGKMSGSYDTSVMQKIVDAAKVNQFDPLTALAVSGQESAFGKYDVENPMRLQLGLHGYQDDSDDIYTPQSSMINQAMDYLRKRTDRQRSQTPDDEELILQSYNGLGKIQGGSEVAEGAEMYGGQTDLHGRRDRPYGKSILQLKEMLAGQPSIQRIIK
jgi:hypothetical protein